MLVFVGRKNYIGSFFKCFFTAYYNCTIHFKEKFNLILVGLLIVGLLMHCSLKNLKIFSTEYLLAKHFNQKSITVSQTNYITTNMVKPTECFHKQLGSHNMLHNLDLHHNLYATA